MFTIRDTETWNQTWIPKEHIDYLACDAEKCVLRYKNMCSPEILKEYERLVKEEKYRWQTANMVVPKYRYAMPHLDKALDKARDDVKNHNKLHGCDGTLLTRVFPKGDPNYETFSNSLNHK